MYHLLVQIFCNALATLVFGALLFFAAREAHAMHCPGCDSPDQGNSDFQRRYEAGKNQPGDGRGTPYEPREINIQRDNREQMEREQRQREEPRRSYDIPYGQSPNRNVYGDGVR